MFRRGLVGYLPVNIVQALAGFGAIMVFTRLLSPEDYGDYALGYSIASLVSIGLFTWIEAAMARFYAAEIGDEARAGLYGTLYRSFAAMTVLVPIVTVVALAVLPLSMGLRAALAAGIGSIITRSLLKLAQERRRAAGEVGGFALYDMAQTGGAFLIGVAMAVAGARGAAPLIGTGVASAACLLFALPSELRMARRGRFERARLGRYAAYGLPISLSLVMGFVLSTTDRFVLAAYLNTAAVGAYHAGYSLSNRTLDIMFIWLGMAGGPAAIAAFERGGAQALAIVAREQAELMALIAIPACIGLALTARPLADLMVGPALHDQAARVTPWIAFSALFAGATTYYFHTAFTLGRRTRLLLAAMAVPAVCNVALCLALVPRFGLDGAMWATTASFAIGLAASATLGRRVIALPIPWSGLSRCALAAGAMAAVLAVLPSPGGVIELALKAVVGAVVYATVVLALNAAGARTQAVRIVQTLRARTA